MTEQGSHIDRYFREGLEGYEPAPPQEVWKRLDGRLPGRKQRVIWLPGVAAAAAVALLVISGLWFMNRQPGEPVKQDETTPVIASKTTSPSIQTPKPAPESETVESRTAEPSSISSSPTQVAEAQSVAIPVASPSLTREIQTAAEPSPDMNPEVAASQLLPIESTLLTPEWGSDLMAMSVRQAEWKEEKPVFPAEMEMLLDKPSRWGVGGQFSPVFSYRHLTSTQGNEDLKRYYDQIEEGVFAFSGGLNLHYEATGKLTVYTGLYYSQMGLNIDRVGEFTLAEMGWETSEIHRKMAEKFYLVDHSTGTIVSDNKNIKIVKTPEDALFNSSFGRDPMNYTQESLENANARIIQNYEFLEVPLMMKYRVVDKKIGMNILGGVSTNILVGNAASLYIEGINYSTIKTSNVTPLNYSGTIGMGVDMEILPGLEFNLEPTFKYYLNTFSEKNLIGSHPYSVAVFSGVRFRF